ncbi:MAG: matrixin family metalloprotease [Sulfuricella sp.]|nr:matrixin family metalloprotease [Sulfuricella sp.]
MKKAWIGIMLGALLGAGSGVSVAGGQFEYVVFGMGGSRWDGGVMKWYYNPQGTPSGISTGDAVAVLQKAAAKWSNGCNFQFQYQGTTTTPTWVTDGINVVGWQSGLSESGTTNSAYSDLRIREADIRFNSATVTSLASLEAVATHEFGHALGLDHSNVADSIMYANPYHSSTDQLVLKSDDITACQALYGASALGTVAKYNAASAVTLAAGETANVYVTTSAPSVSSPPTSSLASISGSAGKVYFSAFFKGMTIGQTLRIDLVAPDGTLYESSSTTGQYAGGYYAFSYNWSGVGASAMPGNWQVYFWAGDNLKAKTQFTNVASADQPQPPEMVVIGKLEGGRFNYSATNLTPSRPVAETVWSFDGGALNSASTPAVTFAAGTHSAQLALRGTAGRYSNQSLGADYLLAQSVPVSAAGTLASAVFSGQTSGSKESLTLQATTVIPSSESSSKNVYVVAQVGTALFYKTAGAWNALQSTAQPLFSTAVPAVATFNIIDAMDVNFLPVGTVIYVGYGDNLDQVVQKASFGKVFTLQ